MDQEFKDIVLISLAKIEVALVQNEKDHIEIKAAVAKIPTMEIGLNNHLHSHDTIRKYVMYPVVVAVIIGVITLFFKMVLRVF